MGLWWVMWAPHQTLPYRTIGATKKQVLTKTLALEKNICLFPFTQIAILFLFAV